MPKLKRSKSCPTAPGLASGLSRSKSDASHATNCSSGSGMTGSGSTNDNHSRRRAKRTVSRKVGTERCEIVKQYLKHVNNGDLDAARSAFTDDCKYMFPGDLEISVQELEQVTEKICSALPDFKFSFRLVEEHEQNGKYVVVVHDIVAEGTHTGAPFEFGPYPAIHPEGKHVKNNPETARFYFDESDKIARAKVIKSGEFAGPAGLYTQLGGIPLM